MRVFVTGASGFIGSAVVHELISAGHEVLGLARSDEAAEKVAALGAEVQRGSLTDLDSLRNGAAATDGVVHTAFIHDFSNYQAAAETDRCAIETIGEMLAGSNRPLVVSSGVVGLTDGRPGAEEDEPTGSAAGRKSEETALLFVPRGVRTSVMRFPPTVHGEGDHGFIAALIGIARAKGVSAYPGDGSNRWSAVHRLDAARLTRLALESAPAGTKLHAVGDVGVPTREIAEVIGRHLNFPVVSVPISEAQAHFGWLGAFFAMDRSASSTISQQRFNWKPEHPSLIEDLELGHYFKQ